MNNFRKSVYVDGSCSGNPGPGGWAVVFSYDRYITGNVEYTTNNRMELQAAIEAVKASNEPIEIFSDSQYVVLGVHRLVRMQKNIDLWKELSELLQEKDVTFTWIKGHNKNSWNELADKLAKEAR